ncbi:MAG TPA: serine/threonine-protein kinase, partial [Kofleriaceae bacterium]|nr:serine/threonine-protein kinase [Kofleriaceae bacterium]
MAVPTPGTEIGPYRIDGVIGAGSMGDVFRAVDVGLNRGVAVKILSERHRESNELRARFTREGRAVAAISHPNVVQVFATGTYQDRPYIAMELLEGTDLASAVEARGPLPALSAARAILDAARGLHAASRAGLIHRDVKPSNLVLLADGRVKVTDFGLAKPVDPGSEPSLTALGVVVGTPDYIAPEQARGETIDERVDLYALGGTLYFLLTGIPPFRTGIPAEDKYLKVVARHLKNPPPDARDRNPAADPALSELARRMLAKKPAERPDYPSLIAELEQIVAILEGRGAPAVTIPPQASGSAGRGSPTPFVGGAAPLALDDETAATHRRARPPDSLGGTRDAPVSGVRPGGLPRWLVVLSVLSLAVFATGLV